MSKETVKQYRSINDAVRMEPFYPNLPRKDFNSLTDNSLILLDAKIYKDFHSQFGARDTAFMKLSDNPDNPDASFTTLSSSSVIVDEIRKTLKAHIMPCMVYITKKSNVNGDNSYYTLNGNPNN